jgi:eukaryotic-like serine/threonine-protein kinase
MNDALPKPPGTLGRYQILGEIARGAMGVIYKARDPLIDRVVAVKTIALAFTPSEIEAFERRFFREAKSAGRLNHPNIVTIYDVGKSGDVAYIAMEYLDGRSLREVLDSGVVLPHDQVAEIGAQVAEGLAFAHGQQVVHRDVKPANIMVLHTGRVKITDFGIALLPTGTRTLTANVFGSPRYTSPEQVMGRPVDGRSDIFSLGAVIYEMLTGLPPFSADDLNGILKQVLSEPTPPPSSHNPTIPSAFDHIIGKALAKDPDDRYQDAAAMAADLRNYASLEFDTPGPAPLPALEHPTGEIRAPRVPASLPDSATDLASAGPATAGRAKLRLGLGIGAAVVLVVIAFAVGLRSPTAEKAAPVTAPVAVATPANEPVRDASEAKSAAPVAASAPAVVAATAAPAPVAATAAPAPPAATASAPTPAAVPAAAPPPATAISANPAATPPPAATVATADAAGTVKPAVSPKPPGRLLLAITPWGEVLVDGRKRGLAPPLSELRVPPGKHTVEIRNSTFPPYTETIEVPSGGEVRIRHKFP